MNPDRKNAAIIGILFIIATVSAILGLVSYAPILSPDYLIKGAENANQIIFGAICELILVCAAIGTSITFFPYLRRQSETLALGYVCFRSLEAVIIAFGIVGVLSLLTLSQEFVKATAPDLLLFQASGTILQAVHTWTFMLATKVILGVNTLIYSYVLYRSNLVPRAISVLGLFWALLILIVGLLEMFSIILPVSTIEVLLALPIALYEMILAVWLIVKGFNTSALRNS